MGWKILGRYQGARNLLALEPSLRLGAVADRRAGEREPRHAVGQLAREHATNRAEAGDGDARHAMSTL